MRNYCGTRLHALDRKFGKTEKLLAVQGQSHKAVLAKNLRAVLSFFCARLADTGEILMGAIRILHVDDEPDIREVVDISLGLNPEFEVRACSSGAEAVVAAAEWSPALILLDVMMPGMDGPTTLQQLHKSAQTANIPVLFMTARAQAREIEHFIALGAKGVISKPFDPMTLASEVSSHLHAIGRA